ncbi:uncharacterized protein L201_006731 [Kwoniella dendrophila CBS 6074]|uniref:Uncharacterized protein n=1 Tax=Kwoniella dendrophila CBS 6074 TaxID=1295534 RepID=A0AAX4K333_9TREE
MQLNHNNNTDQEKLIPSETNQDQNQTQVKDIPSASNSTISEGFEAIETGEKDKDIGKFTRSHSPTNSMSDPKPNPRLNKANEPHRRFPILNSHYHYYHNHQYHHLHSFLHLHDPQFIQYRPYPDMRSIVDAIDNLSISSSDTNSNNGVSNDIKDQHRPPHSRRHNPHERHHHHHQHLHHHEQCRPSFGPHRRHHHHSFMDDPRLSMPLPSMDGMRRGGFPSFPPFGQLHGGPPGFELPPPHQDGPFGMPPPPPPPIDSGSQEYEAEFFGPPPHHGRGRGGMRGRSHGHRFPFPPPPPGRSESPPHDGPLGDYHAHHRGHHGPHFHHEHMRGGFGGRGGMGGRGRPMCGPHMRPPPHEKRARHSSPPDERDVPQHHFHYHGHGGPQQGRPGREGMPPPPPPPFGRDRSHRGFDHENPDGYQMEFDGHHGHHHFGFPPHGGRGGFGKARGRGGFGFGFEHGRSAPVFA